MNSLKIQLFVLILSSIATAQVSTETLSQEVDAEIEKMYSEQSVPVSNSSSSSNSNRVTTVINNEPRVTVATIERQQVQKQPVTLIEATPLSNSSADAIRKNRMEEEMRTETRIVEKLENSRMEDEKRRASVLFGDKFNKLNNQKHEVEAEEAAPVAPVAHASPVMAPSSYIQPQPIIIQQDSLSRDDVQQEVRAALDEDKTAAQERISLFEKKYFSMIAGVPQYSNANGIQGNYSLGFNIGTTNNFLQVEGGFIYSNYLITAAQYVNQFNYVHLADFALNQYQTYVATKIQLLDGDIQPSVGVLASYSFRKYVADSATTYGNKGTEFGQSSAIDLGLTAGIDLALNKRFSLGADLKYMFNISSNINGTTSSNASSPEKLSYYLLGLTAKMMF